MDQKEIIKALKVSAEKDLAFAPLLTESHLNSVAIKEIQRLQRLVEAAPQFFHPTYDFDGRKKEWLVNANLVSE